MKTQKRHFCRLFGFCLLAVVLMTQEASAQSPPLSPWLSLFNDNRGNILDNYHTFVAPQIQMQKDFAQQEQQIQRQQAGQKSLESQLDKALNAPKKRASFAPGNGAGYRQYLHYYKGLPQGGPPYHGKR